MDCLICKNLRPFCIHTSYPLPRIYQIEKQVEEKLKQDFFGPSVSVFVGHSYYPNVFVGPLASLEETSTKSMSTIIDNPTNWFGIEYQKIIEMRAFLLRSKQKENIFSKSKFIEENQELALAEKPTDTEIKFKKKPFFSFQLSETTQPMGPVGTLEKFKITENTKINPKIESIVRDDLKAVEAAFLLYENNQDVYKVSTILSSGILGQKENQKLVPTRWSITAVDDIIGKQLIEEVKSYPPVSDFLVFESFYLDNKFAILLMPGAWEFENFETWAPGSYWSKFAENIIEEYEPFDGRKEYADKQAGGYYACRFSVLEFLSKAKRQARVIGFREIYEGYQIPVGVWAVRENVRNAFRNKAKRFSTKEEALAYIKSRLRIPVEEYKKKSVILRQKRVWDFV